MGKGKTRRTKVASRLRNVIAKNVKARAEYLFKDSKNLPKSIRDASALADREKLTKSWVQLVMAGAIGISIDQLDSLAKTLDLSPYQLLLEDLDPRNPQVAKGASIGEAEVYKISKRAAQEAVEEALGRTDPGRPAQQRKK